MPPVLNSTFKFRTLTPNSSDTNYDMDYQNMPYYVKQEYDHGMDSEEMTKRSKPKTTRKKIHIKEHQKIQILNFIRNRFHILYRRHSKKAGTNYEAHMEWERVYELCLRYEIFL